MLTFCTNLGFRAIPAKLRENCGEKSRRAACGPEMANLRVVVVRGRERVKDQRRSFAACDHRPGIVLPGCNCVAHGYRKRRHCKAAIQGASLLHDYVGYPINAIRSLFCLAASVLHDASTKRGARTAQLN